MILETMEERQMQCKKRLLAVMISIFCMLIFISCGKKEPVVEDGIVYEFGDSRITFGEFYIYAKTVEEDYRKTYGNGIWGLELTVDDTKSTVRDVTVRDLIANINRVKVLVGQAEKMEISLGDNERAEAENVAAIFYNGLTEDDLSRTGLTRELVVRVIGENMLAAKVYDQMIAEYDFEISEEEARMTTFYDMVFECYGVKKDGTIEEYTEEKKAAQFQKANEALSSLAQEEGMSYEMIAEKYELEYAASYTMSRMELAEEYGESVAERILALADGEISTVIQSEYGYHIFKMLRSKDEELTQKNWQDIVAGKKREYFNGIYEEWVKDYDSGFNMDKDVNMELVGQFPFTEEK